MNLPTGVRPCLPIPIKYWKRKELESLGIEMPRIINFKAWELVIWDKKYNINIWDFIGIGNIWWVKVEAKVTDFSVREVQFIGDKVAFREWSMYYRGWSHEFSEDELWDRPSMSKSDLIDLVLNILNWESEWSFQNKEKMKTAAKYKIKKVY